MLDALLLEDEAADMVLAQHRVIGADLLDEAAVARAARVGDDDRVEGALLGAAACQSDLESHGCPFDALCQSVSFKRALECNRTVIASEAKQSRAIAHYKLDCFVAPLLAM